jgi:hypothetical protein
MLSRTTADKCKLIMCCDEEVDLRHDRQGCRQIQHGATKPEKYWFSGKKKTAIQFSGFISSQSAVNYVSEAGNVDFQRYCRETMQEYF